MTSKALANALRYFDSKDGELVAAGIPVSRIVREHGTPLYLYDMGVAYQKLLRLGRSLPPEVGIHYAVKANSNPGVLEFFAKQALGFDVASQEELSRVLAAGAAPADCGFAGPGKSRDELAYATDVGIGTINAESLRELEIIDELASAKRVRANVSLRINPQFQLRRAGMIIGGGPQQFGIDQELVPDVLARMRRMDSLNFTGFHIFAGSQNLDATALLDVFERTFGALQELLHACPRTPLLVNLGGGFGIPYFASDDELDVEAVGQGLTALLQTYRPHFSGTHFTLELGRYLVGECGVYLTRVRYKKCSRGETFLITDGGLHQHLAATGNFGQVVMRNFPIAAVCALQASPQEKVNIVGPLCTPLDIWGSKVILPVLQEGDIIGIFASGAYGFSASPRDFLSHPHPQEVLVAPAWQK